MQGKYRITLGSLHGVCDMFFLIEMLIYRCEQAINYLTRWQEIMINLKDQDQGYTPLHLATITGNSKIVRRLLIKGGDPKIRDNVGKKPADLAKENHFNNIFKMLESSCKAGECYQITPAFHYKKTKVCFFTFWMIFWGINVIMVLIDFPGNEDFSFLKIWNLHFFCGIQFLKLISNFFVLLLKLIVFFNYFKIFFYFSMLIINYF